jgi:hypothetical protein
MVWLIVPILLSFFSSLLFSRDETVQLSLHNNSFDGLGKDTCKLSVFDSGEMVEFSADCDICDCQVLCDRCSTDGGGDAGPQNP